MDYRDVTDRNRVNLMEIGINIYLTGWILDVGGRVAYTHPGEG